MGQHVYIDVYWQPSAMGLRVSDFLTVYRVASSYQALASAPVQNCSLQDTGSPEVRVRHCNRDPDAIFNQLVCQSVWTRQVRSKKGRLLGVFTPCGSCTQQTVGIKFWMSDTGMGRVGRVTDSDSSTGKTCTPSRHDRTKLLQSCCTFVHDHIKLQSPLSSVVKCITPT